MKRLHVHVAVDDLDRSIGFYSTLFAAEPSVREAGYAKWMLDDPKVNFAISSRGRAHGIDHLGIQVDSNDELRELSGRLKSAGEVTRDQEATVCCYAQSNKAWVNDPSGVRWETFFTFGGATQYGEDDRPNAAPKTGAGSCGAPCRAQTRSVNRSFPELEYVRLGILCATTTEAITSRHFEAISGARQAPRLLQVRRTARHLAETRMPNRANRNRQRPACTSGCAPPKRK